MMLTKKQNTRMNYFSRLLVLPLIVIVFAAFAIKAKTLSVEKNTPFNPVEKILNKITGNTIEKEKIGSSYSLTNKQITVVIDAGHGGDDTGAGNDKGLYEKNLALQLIKKIKILNSNRNIKIILTREDDTYSTPQERAAFAKAQNPDLFISVHLDGSPKPRWNIATGMNVFIANDEIANNESSKILASALIASFKRNYELTVVNSPMRRKSGIWILKANSFPSVLIEAGYLTNKNDAAYLKSKKGQETFAINVLNAINDFAESKDFTEKKEVIKITPAKIPYNDTIGFYKGKAVVNAFPNLQNKTINIVYADGKKETITKQEAIDDNFMPKRISNSTSAGSSIEVKQASDEDVKLFKLMGKVFIRVETDGNIPKRGDRIIVRDGVIINPEGAKFFKGDLIENLAPKAAIEKYGEKASGGALEITTKKISVDPVFRIGDLTGV